MNWPNRLTLFRIILVPVFVMTVVYKRLDIALVIFLIAAITDGLDGYLARVRKEKTKFGAIMDPIADKMLIGSAFISFSVVSGLPDYLRMPIYVPIIVIFRDVFILMGAAAIHLLTGKIDVKPTVIGKITAFFQMLTIITILMKFPYAHWMWNITVLLSIISVLDYMRIASGQINGKM